MKFPIYKVFPFLISLLWLVSCNFTLTEGGSNDDAINGAELVAIASSVSDFQNLQTLASMGKVEVEDLEDETVENTSNLLFKTIFIDEWTKVLPDGTLMTITKTLDDGDTPEDSEDDIVTVIRSHEIWSGAAERIEKIVRPRRPEPDWSSWDDSTLIWEGQISVFIDGVRIQEGTITVTWFKTGEEVRVGEVIKEVHRMDRNGVIEKLVVTVESDGTQSKTKYRIRLTHDGEIVVHSFTYIEIEEEGETYTKIIRDDGSYAIVRQARDPRIVDYYSPDDIRRLRVTETRVGKQLHVIKEFFDEDGVSIGIRELDIEFRFVGDEVIITKSFSEGRQYIVRIQEIDSGYCVNRNGVIFTVKFTPDGIEIYNMSMSWVATVVINDDGSWTIIYPDTSTETVNLT